MFIFVTKANPIYLLPYCECEISYQLQIKKGTSKEYASPLSKLFEQDGECLTLFINLVLYKFAVTKEILHKRQAPLRLGGKCQRSALRSQSHTG